MIQATLEKKKKKVTLVTNMAEEHEAMKLSDGPIFLQPYTLKPLKYIIHATQKKKKRILVAGYHIVRTFC